MLASVEGCRGRDDMKSPNEVDQIRWGGVAADHWTSLYPPAVYPQDGYPGMVVDHSHEGRISSSDLCPSSLGFTELPRAFRTGPTTRLTSTAFPLDSRLQLNMFKLRYGIAVDEKARFLSQLCHETASTK